MGQGNRSKGASGKVLAAKRLATWLVVGLGVLATYSSAQAQTRKPSEGGRAGEFQNFVVEGAIAGALQVELRVFDPSGKMLDGTTLTTKDGAFEGSLPLPLGVKVSVQVQAYDSMGKPFAQGAHSALFNDMVAGSATIDVATQANASRGALTIAPLKLELTSELIYGETRQYQLRGIDAYGRQIPIDPNNVAWSVPFPEGVKFIPCKPSGPGLACIELNVPLRVNPYLVACLKDVFCRGQHSGNSGGGAPPSGYRMISAGEHFTCAVSVNDKILCFGENGVGQLGRVTTETCALPPPFTGGVFKCGKTPQEIICQAGDPCTYLSVDAGLQHACAVDSNRHVYCWGSNGSSQVGFSCAGSGNPNCLNVTTPNRVYIPSSAEDLFPRIVQVSAGHDHSCALSERGSVYCWGDNTFSQSGSAAGSQVQRINSKEVYSHVSAGKEHTCATTLTGELDCWGGNNLKQIQAGPLAPLSFPNPVSMRAIHPGLMGRIDFARAGDQQTCAYAQGSGVLCWGSAMTGDVTVSSAPASDLELGYYDPSLWASVCAVNSGTIACGVTPGMLASVLGSPTQLVDSTVGRRHFCAVRSNGEAFCWGSNNMSGQMGDGTTTAHAIPGRVLGP